MKLTTYYLDKNKCNIPVFIFKPFYNYNYLAFYKIENMPL